MNHPLATRFDQFLKERTYLHNVTPRTLVWYRIAFKNYVDSLPREQLTLPTKSTLERFVIAQRERGLRPVTCNTNIGAMNAFCRWLHEEGDIPQLLNLKRHDVDVDNLLLKVFGKGRKERLVPFSPELRKRIYRYSPVTGARCDRQWRASRTARRRGCRLAFDRR